MLTHILRAAAGNNTSGFIGTTELSTTSNTNSLSIAYPAGTRDGDLAFMAIATGSNLSSGYSSSGWTSLDVDTSRSVKAQLLYRVVSGTGTQSFTKGSFDPNGVACILAVFRAFTYSSFSVVATNGTVNPPSRSGTFNAVVCFGMVNVNDSSITPPSGYTTLGEINNSVGITTCGAYFLGAVTNPDPGAFGGVSSADYVAYTIGLT